MTKRFRLIACFVACAVLLPGVASSAAPRVYRDSVAPVWIDSDHFWYKIITASNQHEFILVDCVAGKRTLAFDHNRVAEALTQQGISNCPPERLPLTQVTFNAGGSGFSFRAGARGWSWDPRSSKLIASSSPATTNRLDSTRLRASTRTGEETTLTFVNQSGAEVGIFWIDTEGQRRSYGKLEAGGTRDQHTFEGHVWLVLDPTGAELGRFEASETGAIAEIGKPAQGAAEPRRERRLRRSSGQSPDHRWTAFIRDHNLGIRDNQKGDEQMLTTDGVEADEYAGAFRWSPDSSRIVVFKTRSGDRRKITLVESSPPDQVQPKLHSLDYVKPGDRLDVSIPHLFCVTNRNEIPIDASLFSEPWSVSFGDWCPDSKEFSVLYNQRGHQVLRLFYLNAETGAPRIVLEERSPTFIDYSGKFYQHTIPSPDGPGEILWMSERDGWNHLFLYDVASGTVKNQVTKGSWVVREVVFVDDSKRQVWFKAAGIIPQQDPYYLHLCRVNFDGSGFTVLTSGDGTHNARLSSDRRWLIDTWSRVDQLPVTELRNAETGALVCELERADGSELVAAGARFPARFFAPGRDDKTPIFGIIHWPADYQPSRKYPVIESIYAGPQGAFVPKAFQAAYGVNSLTRLGFVVVQIDGMGTSYRSKAFHDVCWKNLGDSGFPDRIKWIQAAASAHPSLDITRVGIYGTSAGAQSALRGLLAHGDFYKAGVADCGCHDNRMDKVWWNEQWMGWPIGSHYAEQSNVTQAHRLQGKLLLMVGELDKNVDPSSTLQVVNALIKADKDFEFLLVPGAGHGVLGIPYAQRRMLDFFTRTLTPAPVVQ